jgi:protein TonB
MFISGQSEPGPRSRAGFFLSTAVHLGLLGMVLYQPAPPLLQPSGTLRGEGGHRSATMLYLPGASLSDPGKPALHEKHSLVLHKAPKRRSPAPAPEAAAVAKGDAKPGRPGNPLGTLSAGFASDHDVRIALPVFAPEPPVVRAKLPEWVRGDVIVEVTIDKTGTVVDTKVLQAVGFGIEEDIVATLRQWHFIPAKIDGIPVASRHDVHFHFPS